MGYIKPIKRIGGSNMAGLAQLLICSAKDIASIPKPINGVIYGNITFASGAGFTQWEATLETLSIKTSKNITKEGELANNRLSLSLPKDQEAIRNMLDIMERDELVILFTYNNGAQKLFGTKERPVRFTYDHDSGAQFSSKNAYDCQFYYSGPDNLYFYAGSTGSPPSSIAPAIVKVGTTVGDAVAVASLSPGQTLTILSDYSFNDYFVAS